ncbi:MAG: hypothetical protein PHD46_06430 [Eubacteriales bacterium]|nr:hypothetical protein [Eubacteriales bacterium]
MNAAEATRRKACTRCREEKPINDFCKNRQKKDGIHIYCKECSSVLYDQWARANKQKNNERKRQYYQKNREAILGKKRDYIACNRDKISDASKRRREKPKIRVTQNISKSIWARIRGRKKSLRWEKLVGFTYEELKKHLEKQFLPGMTWDNYGKWHIDHKTPVAAFNFQSTEDLDFKKCWALENLQPLWAKDNQNKGVKLEHLIQPSLTMEKR